ncbi:hypothetical protein [Methanolapillus africanus]
MIIKIFGLNIDPILEVRKRIDGISDTDYMEMREDIITIIEEQDKKRFGR